MKTQLKKSSSKNKKSNLLFLRVDISIWFSINGVNKFLLTLPFNQTDFICSVQYSWNYSKNESY